MKKIIASFILILILIMPAMALAGDPGEAETLCETQANNAFPVQKDASGVDQNTTARAEYKASCKANFIVAPITSRDDITDLIISITNWFATIVFAIAVIMIIYGGLLYITARGSEETAKKAKNLLLYACIGIAVAILAFGAGSLIQNFLKIGQTTLNIPVAFAADTIDPIEYIEGKLGYQSPITTPGQISGLIVAVLNWFAAIVFAIAVIMIIYGAVLYITAAGSEEKAKTARKLLLYACIGIAVAMLAFGAQALISSFLTLGQ